MTVTSEASALASYVWGECTYFVAMAATTAEGVHWIPAGLGDAKDWFARAPGKGVSTSKAPVEGDVIVFKNQSPYDTTAGHVGIVQSVGADWSIVVKEMNFTNGLGKTDTRTISKQAWQRDSEGFLVNPDNSKQIPLAFGQYGSRQQIAEGLLSTGQNANAGGSLVPNPSRDQTNSFDFGSLQKLLGFITDPKEWFRILIIGTGVVFIFIGMTGYFAQRMPKVAPIPV